MTATEFFARLGETERQACFLTAASGEGWPTVIAWSPADSFVGYRNSGALPKFLEFVARNQAQGRKLVGYLSYDLGYELHGIKQLATDDLALPDMYFLAYDNYLTFSGGEMKAAHPEPEYLEAIGEIKRRTPVAQPAASRNFETAITEEQYAESYRRIQDYIRQGDIYQINFTHRLQAETSLSPRALFPKVLAKNPVDFSAYLEGDGFAVLSASPERFVQVQGSAIRTFPIKGTRPRGKTAEQDEALRQELLDSEKEAAELNMITDLLRNDLGKVCEVGSVRVSEHRVAKAYPSVWHTHSLVEGVLPKGVPAIEAVLSMFPGGSITGCPKKRAMQVIDELEPTTRGVYTGCIGTIDPNGDGDFSIAIRTIIQKGSKAYLSVGGGIVYDSNGAAELRETFDKARSFMDILN